MIELREDGSIPGKDEHGQVYKVIDPMTGEVGYNLWLSDLPKGEPRVLAMIQGYDSFSGFASDILSADEAQALVKKLNAGPKVYEETAHTRLVKRVRQRLTDGNGESIDGFTALQDMAEMVKDIEGRRVRPALPGWKK